MPLFTCELNCGAGLSIWFLISLLEMSELDDFCNMIRRRPFFHVILVTNLWLVDQNKGRCQNYSILKSFTSHRKFVTLLRCIQNALGSIKAYFRDLSWIQCSQLQLLLWKHLNYCLFLFCPFILFQLIFVDVILI